MAITSRQLDLQVRSNLVNYFLELMLGSMHVLLIRNNREDQQGLGEGQGVKEEELGQPHQGGVQVHRCFCERSACFWPSVTKTEGSAR
jgi:hypothetical protein